MPIADIVTIYNSYNLEQWNLELTRITNEINSTREAMRLAISEGSSTGNGTQSLAALRERKAFLDYHIPLAKSYIETFENNPAQLVIDLRRGMQELLIDYENNHFSTVSPEVRISLFNLKYGLYYLIVNNDNVGNYLRLCSMLGEMYSRVQQENQDQKFLNGLTELARSIHCNPQQGMASYQGQKVYYSDYFADSIEDLSKKELVIYQQAFQLLNKEKYRTPFQDKIQIAAYYMNEEIKRKIRQQEPVDYYFYNRVAEDLIALDLNPTNAQATQRLLDVAKYITGSDFFSNKFTSSMLILAGTLLMMTSLAFCVATMGSSSLISSLAFAMGLDLFLTKAFVVLAVAPMTTAIGGGLTMWGALKYSQVENLENLSNSLLDIGSEAETAPMPS